MRDHVWWAIFAGSILLVTSACASTSSSSSSSSSPEADAAPPEVVCTPGMDQTCNDDIMISSLHGACLPDGTCECLPQFAKNPATGLCK